MTKDELLCHALESAHDLATRLDSIITSLMGEDAALDDTGNVGLTRPPKHLVEQFPVAQQPMLYEFWLAREEACSLGGWIDDHMGDFEGGQKNAGTTID